MTIDYTLITVNAIKEVGGLRDHEEVKLGAHITKDLGFDSLDALELIMHLEEDLDLTINDNEITEDMTVQQVIDFVKKKKEP